MKRIVLLCGLPGSGKTTYAKKLPYTFLNFDDFWTSYCNQDIERFKESQNKFFEFVKYCLLPSYCSSPSSTPHEENDFFTQYKNKLFLKLSSDRKMMDPNLEDQETYLVEDNFYYRSMRDKYYRFARDKEIIFGMIFLIAPVEECLSRNSKRNAKVTEETIRNMSKKIEYEKSLETSQIEKDSDGNGSQYVLNVDTSHDDFTSNINTIDEFVSKLGKLPKLKVKDMDEVEKSNEANLKSTIHQFDLWSRKEFTNFMKSKVPKMKKREVGKALGKARKDLLNELKKGRGENLDELRQKFQREMESFLET